ncbi:MAG: lactate racemase domain-containing protein [Candidatus Aminicenantes bacterium]|nr:lactate racemase domain-containing protein [Candidatus Aminicenantes bacterium]
MNTIKLDLGHTELTLQVPASAVVLQMGAAPRLRNPRKEIERSLRKPIGSPPLQDIIRSRLRANPEARAVVVLSDNTRPVPYKGKEGLLVPLLQEMKRAGLKESAIQLLIATGTHHPLNEKAVRALLPDDVFRNGIQVLNHNCRRMDDLVHIGDRPLLGKILINRHYRDADIKILTGLVESHFMAGASGGRKSICPGLIGEHCTQLIHGGHILSSPKAADLVLEGNPVHEEALAVARMVGCDFIVNVTLNAEYSLSGVFSGDLVEAHKSAVRCLQSYVGIPVRDRYDLVITHAGFVGINHYQAAKAGAVCASILEPDGYCILAARHPDNDPIGGPHYKKMLRLLNDLGPDMYEQAIKDPDWTFVPEQWEPQMWARLFRIIPPDHLLYCCPDIREKDFDWIPGTDAQTITARTKDLSVLLNRTVDWTVAALRRRLNRPPRIAILKDGPYAIPLLRPDPNS